MKKRIIACLMLSLLIFSGCSGKVAVNSGSNSNISNKSSATNNIKTNLKSIKPGTIPQLSTQQKNQIDSKLNSAVSNVDDALNSLQNANDIDLSSVN